MKHRLELLTPVPLEITWHENKTSYLSVKKERGRIFLRVHRLFYDAPSPVLEALIQYAIGRDRVAKSIIRQMAHLYFSQNQAPAKKLSTLGNVYDLNEIFERVKQILWVENVTIGWSERVVRGRFRSITFGCYDQHTRQIRINPILDQSEVPLYFLEYIVYHEMLHVVCPTQMDTQGRCTIHSREFREKERQFPLFREAKSWEKKSLTLFKRISRGRP